MRLNMSWAGLVRTPNWVKVACITTRPQNLNWQALTLINATTDVVFVQAIRSNWRELWEAILLDWTLLNKVPTELRCWHEWVQRLAQLLKRSSSQTIRLLPPFSRLVNLLPLAWTFTILFSSASIYFHQLSKQEWTRFSTCLSIAVDESVWWQLWMVVLRPRPTTLEKRSTSKVQV